MWLTFLIGMMVGASLGAVLMGIIIGGGRDDSM